MIDFQTTRDQEIFAAYLYSQTVQSIDVESDTNGDVTAGNSYYSTVVISNDADSSYTYSNGNNIGTYSIPDSGNSYVGEAGASVGATTFACLTLYSTASSSADSNQAITLGPITYDTTSFESSDDATILVTSTADGTSTAGAASSGNNGTTAQSAATEWQISVASSSSATINISSNVDTTTSQWTVTGLSGRSFATTYSTDTTALSNADSDGLLTETVEITFAGDSTSSQAINQFCELGTVVIADSDWLWQFNDLPTWNGAYSFLTDVATSFTQSTFWNNYSTSAVDYYAYGSDASTSSYTFAESAYTLTWEYLTTGDASTITATSGSNFPRDTYTTTVPVWTTSSDSATFGQASYEIDDYMTSAQDILSNTFFAITVYSTYPKGLADADTTTLLSTSSALTTSTQAVAQPAYLSFVAGGGVTQAQTVLYANGPNYNAITNGNTYFETVPPVGAFLAPQMLVSGSNLSFGGNLLFDGQTIYYPFINGVYSNVVVPFGGTATVSGTVSDSWRYNWNTNSAGATLLYSHYSSGVSGATISSGVFSTDSDLGEGYVTTQTVFGGFGYDKTAAETAYFDQRAVYGTLIGTDGSSTTYQSLITDTASSTLSATLQVEQGALAYQAYQNSDGTPAAYLAFPRNEGG